MEGEVNKRPGVKMPRMRRSLSVDKGLGAVTTPLPAPVDRLFYVRGDVHVPSPACNPLIPPLVRNASLIILGPGSLFTSLIASLVLPGVGEALTSARRHATRVLALNSGPDRESGSLPASSFVASVVRALSRYGELDLETSDVLDAILVSQDSQVALDVPALSKMGIDSVVRLPCRCPVQSAHKLGGNFTNQGFHHECLGGSKEGARGARGTRGHGLEAQDYSCTHLQRHAVGELCPSALRCVLDGIRVNGSKELGADGV